MNGIKIVELPKFLDVRGNLTFVEEEKHVPFEIQRTYWIYDVPGGEVRGGHSYKKNQELIVALSGSFDVVVNNGRDSKRYTMNRSYYGLYVPSGIWRHLENFSTNSLAFIAASIPYDEFDYIRDFEQFINSKK